MSFKRCFHGMFAAIAVGVLSSVLAIAPAHAVGETPTVDGNLADLIAAVNANLGSDQGGFAFVDPASDVFTGTCAYVNGYDIVKSYAYFKLKNGSGAYTPNDVTLYLGWEVTGQIGDVDGDGNADTFDSNGPGIGCALSDGGGNTGCASGIGVGESYSILLNLNCAGADDLRLGVSNNKVGTLSAGGDLLSEIAGATFCRVGSFLEVSIPHYENLLKDPALVAIGATLCQANLRMVANAGDDLLAEDTTPVQQLRIPGSIAITKTPASQDACPGSDVSWTIQVCNDGICPFATVTVTDTLDAGLTYKSDDKGSVQGPNAQIRVWTFSNLNPGDCQTISLTSTVDFPCAAAVLNNNVGVEAVEPASPCSELAEAASAHASASVNCKQPDVSITKGQSKTTVGPGETTTITLTISNPGNSVLDPVNVCDKLDAGTSFDGAQAIGGTCGVSLDSNTLNGDGTRTLCFSSFSLNPGGSCTITYAVGCGTTTTHVDTATVTAYCQGEDEHPVIRQASSSFNCACPADVEIDKSITPGTAQGGEAVTVTLTIRNAGSSTLDPINVCDKLDAGVGFDAAQTIGGTCGVTLSSNTLNGNGTRDICFSAFSLAAGASCTITYQLTCVGEGDHPDTATVVARCQGGGENDTDRDQAESSFTCAVSSCCWLTMGGFLNGNFRSGHKDNTFGGNVGPPPSGSWEHIQREGKTATFNFHSHDAHVIQCIDDGGDGPCNPKGDANIILFGGTGVYNFGTGSRDQDAVWTARAEDRGEPGRQGTQTGGCGSADFYSIEVRNAETNEIAFTASGYLDGGNIQIHSCKNAHQTAPPKRGGQRGTLGSDGTSTGVDAASDAIVPLELYRPQPNPFQNSTSIAYAVGGAGQDVQIGIYNVAGRLIRNLASGFQAAGRYTVQWDGRSADGSTVPGGVYFLRAYVGGQQMSAAASRILYLR